ncbi:cytochrome c oxidase assembly protein subunit 15 [Sphingomonas guangdongensis]|uniref:Heme A synthase n=1 Tax=Sphingomonas guangdongensis TaxID=1141890 RepID=A0A285R267_9SPHN|nr:COX15/CtaA family protein [Sphingomonas guangdongensis]SOB88200.1 cytochrome c oxidase assembly protein subunit 15 [Sphingomonas guangdongensis]
MLAPPLQPTTARPLAVARWLYAVAALIVVMVVVGGITRLTESGLSITEWRPVTGTLPPLSNAAWAAEFAKYQRIPEYQQLNQGMTLAQFKGIFFWEYVHRLLGRVIGIAFAVPLIWFAIRRAIPAGYGPRLVALLALGGLQGAIGWWMVTSGLAERTDVSHVRLAVHLNVALLILAGIVWTAQDLSGLGKRRERPARLTGVAAAALAILFLQLIYGALMAGLNAGLAANDWPLMNGRAFPGEVLGARKLLDAAINDPFLVHWIHRWWAFVAFAALMLLARAAKRSGDRRASVLIHASVGTQILLGIATVMAGVPIWLAALHQLVGALLLIAAVAGAHAIGRGRA